jgi:hypothetical protein
MFTNAIRYWEPRRLLYNAALAAVVLGHYFSTPTPARPKLDVNGLLFLFVLAVLANLCYCAAYVADIFAQYSGFRTFWLQWRWLLLALGIVLAATITHFFSMGLIH